MTDWGTTTETGNEADTVPPFILGDGHGTRPPAAAVGAGGVQPVSLPVSAGHSRRWLGIALGALSGIGYGTQSILAKFAYEGGAGVPTVLTLRFTVGALLLWAIYRWRAARQDGPEPTPPRVRQRLAPLVLGLLFVTSALFAYLALERLPAGTTTLLVFIYPALVVLWSRLIFGERLTAWRGAALGLALVGCTLTVNPWVVVTAGAGLSWAGIGWALGSAVSNSWYAIVAGSAGRGVSGLATAASSLPVTAVCFVVGLVALGGPNSGITIEGWVASLAIGILTALSTSTFLASVALIGPSRGAIVATSEPVTAVLLGAVLLGEPLTASGVIGGVCVIGAIMVLALGRSAAESRPAGLGERSSATV